MQDLLSNPAVQGGVAPFVAALVIAFALSPVRLGGLAVAAAFAVCVYFVLGFQFSPLTALRKVTLLVLAATLVGMLVDFAYRPPYAGLVLAIISAAAALWAFWPVLVAKPSAELWPMALTLVFATAFTVGFAYRQLAADGVRAGAVGLALGLGVGIAAIIGASAALGLVGIALGAGAGGFLLPQMIRGVPAHAGATFTLTSMLAGSLVASATMVLAQLPWYGVLVLALVPLAACLPLPATGPVWLRAVLCSIYAFLVAGAACVLAWPSTQ